MKKGDGAATGHRKAWQPPVPIGQGTFTPEAKRELEKLPPPILLVASGTVVEIHGTRTTGNT